MSSSELKKFLNVKKLKVGEKTLSYPCLEDVMKHDAAVSVLNDFHPELEFDRVKAYQATVGKGIINGYLGNPKEFKRLFAKESSEGILREALGLELNNLLTDRKVPYALYFCVTVTTEVEGQEFDVDWISQDIERYAYQYGMIEEFSRPIGLDDRDYRNLIVSKDNLLYNIDFGQAFLHDSSYGFEDLKYAPQPPPDLERWRPTIEKGKEDARQIIKSNIEKNMVKLQGIMGSIDEEVFAKTKWKPLDMREIHNPKDVLLKYVSDNGWEELDRELQKVN